MELRERKTEKTLKEKIKEHYHNRDFTVKEEEANTLGKAFFWGMVVTLFLESQFILIPGLYWEDTWKMVVCILLVWFTLFESVVNWMGVYFGFTSFVTPDVKEKLYGETSETPPGWRNCAVCQVDAPPRSHHCKHCNRCVLKRDHHCFFTNSCVGFYNQRFFVMFCIYMIWGNLYALFLQLSYLNQYINIVSWDGLTYIPVFAIIYFLIGKLSILNFFLIIHACFCVMCLLGAIFFTVWQLLLATSGVTSHEAWKRKFSYKQSAIANLQSVFGAKLWNLPLQLLFPFRVDQGGNGVEWKVGSKSVKEQ